MRAVRDKKALLKSAVKEFNTKPKTGIEHMKEHKIISSPPLAVEVAQFLRQARGLSPHAVGDYISDPNDFNVAVLEVTTSMHTSLMISYQCSFQSFRNISSPSALEVFALMKHFASSSRVSLYLAKPSVWITLSLRLRESTSSKMAVALVSLAVHSLPTGHLL